MGCRRFEWPALQTDGGRRVAAPRVARHATRSYSRIDTVRMDSGHGAYPMTEFRLCPIRGYKGTRERGDRSKLPKDADSNIELRVIENGQRQLELCVMYVDAQGPKMHGSRQRKKSGWGTAD